MTERVWWNTWSEDGCWSWPGKRFEGRDGAVRAEADDHFPGQQEPPLRGDASRKIFGPARHSNQASRSARMACCSMVSSTLVSTLLFLSLQSKISPNAINIVQWRDEKQALHGWKWSSRWYFSGALAVRAGLSDSFGYLKLLSRSFSCNNGL